ncbi:hypothetical protein N7452_009739 [Penicillium brevicompactum]|uniref:MARVEL domain-containing protein n=1 Tax=Penicillium brevicompactum TaxID=5074 RepID=A0A9W9QAF2_PENBR|nr:hypothetical protein N7452_009739 [Penicillium brevicompactum]
MPKRLPTKLDQYWHKGGVCGLVPRAALRTLQFVFAITVAGLYGVDLARATKSNTAAPTEWVYAEIVAALSAITCIIHCFVTVVHVAWSTWDGVLFVLWLAQTGVFGNIYTSGVKTSEYRTATSSLPRMQAAVWIDLVNMLTWFTTFILGIAWCCRTRKMTRRTDQLETTEGTGMTNDVDVESALSGYKKELEELDAKRAAIERSIIESKEKPLGTGVEKDSKMSQDTKKG